MDNKDIWNECTGKKNCRIMSAWWRCAAAEGMQAGACACLAVPKARPPTVCDECQNVHGRGVQNTADSNVISAMYFYNL
jgi:hypothetical protein